jgi:hypothetical protein
VAGSLRYYWLFILRIMGNMNIFCDKNAESLNVKAGTTWGNHCVWDSEINNEICALQDLYLK